MHPNICSLRSIFNMLTTHKSLLPLLLLLFTDSLILANFDTPQQTAFPAFSGYQNNLRTTAYKKSSITNDISNNGDFSFTARFNGNRVQVQGSLVEHFNGTKELVLSGYARVILISKGFNTQPAGFFSTFDNFADFEFKDECPPTSFAGAAAPGIKTIQTILG